MANIIKHKEKSIELLSGKYIVMNFYVLKKISRILIIFLFLAVIAEPSKSFGSEKVVFGTDWFADAAHGGYYQAVAKGIYKKFGLKVKIDMGGPQINGQQLLVAGRYQFYMSSALDNLVAVAHGLPLVTVATVFQKSPSCIYTRSSISSLSQLKPPYRILVSSNDINTWWPWVMRKYKLQPSQRGIFTGSIAPFLADKNIVLQGFVGVEDYDIAKTGLKFNTFMLSSYGYPDYAETIETTRSMIKNHPNIVKRFIEASMLGWKSYLNNPEPGNKLILKANPLQSLAELDYGVRKMLQYKVFTDKETKTNGLGIMTNARWNKIFKLAVRNHLVPSNLNYKQAYTLKFIRGIHVKLTKN